ncbi:unnamed protein product [Staurois parvus]|uniref:Secreted protein n=1 Tax=Staurois parvus TaxID=386267 RepID=A0ABN9E125_9NEOB|nr:unnamed protein product [Staurois parvus]
MILTLLTPAPAWALSLSHLQPAYLAAAAPSARFRHLLVSCLPSPAALLFTRPAPPFQAPPPRW